MFLNNKFDCSSNELFRIDLDDYSINIVTVIPVCLWRVLNFFSTSANDQWIDMWSNIPICIFVFESIAGASVSIFIVRRFVSNATNDIKEKFDVLLLVLTFYMIGIKDNKDFFVKKMISYYWIG